MTATTAEGGQDARPPSHWLAELAERSGPQALLCLAVALALSGVFALLAGVEDGDERLTPAQQQFADETASALDEPGAPGREVTSLDELLTPAIEGATPVEALTGPLDAAAAVLNERQQGALEQAFEDLGFVSGWRRGWLLTDGRLYVEQVLEFPDSERAELCERGLIVGVGNSPGAKVDPFDEGSIVTYTFTDDDGRVKHAGELFVAVGHRVLHLIVVSDQSTDSLGELQLRAPALMEAAR